MMGQQTESDSFLPERFSLVHCEKHSDIFRTRRKKKRELEQLVQNTILPIKCSFRFVHVLSLELELLSSIDHAADDHQRLIDRLSVAQEKNLHLAAEPLGPRALISCGL